MTLRDVVDGGLERTGAIMKGMGDVECNQNKENCYGST